MPLFAPDTRNRSPRIKRIYAAYEIGFTCVDFAAAICFTIGSYLFFFPTWENPAVSLFLIGSICFMAKPTIRLAREIHFLAIGDVDDVAQKLGA